MANSRSLEILINAKNNASQAFKAVSDEAKTFGKNLSSAGLKLSEFNRVAVRTGTVMAGFGAAGLGFAIKKAAELEQSIANAISVTGVFGDEALVARKKAMELAEVLGQETAFTAAQAGEAMYDLASKGRDVANMTKKDLIPFLD